MPRISLKSDPGGADETACPLQAREVRNTTTANSALATATTISDLAIGAASKDGPFVSTTAMPAGNTIAPIMWSQPCTFASVVVPAAGTNL